MSDLNDPVLEHWLSLRRRVGWVVAVFALVALALFYLLLSSAKELAAYPAWPGSELTIALVAGASLILLFAALVGFATWVGRKVEEARASSGNFDRDVTHRGS